MHFSYPIKNLFLPALFGATAFVHSAACASEAMTNMASGHGQTSISILGGDGYKNPYSGEEESFNTLTFEHFSSWSAGDNYFFFDVAKFNDNETDPYGEWLPRLNVGKLLGKSLSWGPVKNVFISGEMDFGAGYRSHYLGAGVDLAIPRAHYFNVNFLWGDRMDRLGETRQLNVSWSFEFHAGKLPVFLNGYLDYVMPDGDAESHLQTQPQLLVDISHLWGGHNKVLTGIEYQYWKNKNGMDGVNESLPQWIVMWNL